MSRTGRTSASRATDRSGTAGAGEGDGVAPERLAGLRRWNLGLAVLHAAQAVVVLVLAGSFAITVTSTFPVGPPGAPAVAPARLFEVRIGWAVAAFLALAAADHLLTATWFRGVYERDLGSGINRFRWVEYSISSTLMVILIGFYSGMTGINVVITVAGANIAMILFGWLQERMNPPQRATTTMLPFWFGTLVGLAPWVSIGVNVIGAATVPGFVYGIVPRRPSSSSASGSTSGCSTAGSAAGRTTPTARRPTWCSASSPSPCSPGRSSPAPSPPEEPVNRLDRDGDHLTVRPPTSPQGDRRRAHPTAGIAGVKPEALRGQSSSSGRVVPTRRHPCTRCTLTVGTRTIL